MSEPSASAAVRRDPVVDQLLLLGAGYSFQVEDIAAQLQMHAPFAMRVKPRLHRVYQHTEELRRGRQLDDQRAERGDLNGARARRWRARIDPVDRFPVPL